MRPGNALLALKSWTLFACEGPGEQALRARLFLRKLALLLFELLLGKRLFGFAGFFQHMCASCPYFPQNSQCIFVACPIAAIAPLELAV